MRTISMNLVKIRADKKYFLNWKVEKQKTKITNNQN